MTALSVPSLNLMPASRVTSGRRRRRVSAWAAGLAVYALAAAGVWGYFAFTGGHSVEVGEELSKAESQLQKLKADRAELRAAVMLARREAEARHEVQFHPDLSVLLRRVGLCAGENITLDRFEVRPMPKPESPAEKPDAKAKPEQKPEKEVKPDLAAAWGYKVRVTGLAASQGEVTRFARELEQLGVFEGVSVQSIKAREAPVILREDGTKIAQPQLFGFEVDAVMSDVAAAKAGGRS